LQRTQTEFCLENILESSHLEDQGGGGTVTFMWILGEEFIEMGCWLKVAHKPVRERSLVLAVLNLCVLLTDSESVINFT
jgi:hypothetical protein